MDSGRKARCGQSVLLLRPLHQSQGSESCYGSDNFIGRVAEMFATGFPRLEDSLLGWRAVVDQRGGVVPASEPVPGLVC